MREPNASPAQVPMLVQSFRNADNEWAIDESLNAACTLSCDQKGRSALLRHGMLKAVEQSMQAALQNHRDPRASSKLCAHNPYCLLSQEGLAMCAKLLAAFSKCAITRTSLSQKPETALVIVAAIGWCRLLPRHATLSIFLDRTLPRSVSAAQLDNVITHDGLLGKVAPGEVHSDLLRALSAATESSSSQHAVLTWGTEAKFEERDSIVDERDSLGSRAVDRIPTTSPAYLEIRECMRLGVARLVDSRISHKDRRNPSNLRSTSSEITMMQSEAEEQIQRTFDLLQAACEVLAHLASHGSSARTMLRAAGVVDICFNVIAAIRNYAARRNNEKLGTNALASAVASLRRVSIVAGHAEPNSLRGVPTIYDVLRSQLSRPSIQQQGLQLMHVLSRTREGAKELDHIPGSWQWLGRAQFHTTKREPYPWAVAHRSVQDAAISQSQGWNATRLANFLGLRGLKQVSCDELQQNVNDLRIMALLPFEGESPGMWQIRIKAFETRNRVSFLDDIIPS